MVSVDVKHRVYFLTYSHDCRQALGTELAAGCRSGDFHFAEEDMDNAHTICQGRFLKMTAITFGNFKWPLLQTFLDYSLHFNTKIIIRACRCPKLHAFQK